MVAGEGDDRHAGVHALDVAQQRRVGSVPAVDGLPRISDEADVRAPAADRLEERELQGVEVLGLVDEEVAEPPAHRPGELLVVADRVERVGQEIVEVDDAPSTFEIPVAADHVDEPGAVERGPPADVARCMCEPIGRHQPRPRPVDVGHHGRGVDLPAGLGQHLAHQPQPVRGDDRCGPAERERPVAQQPQRDGVERACLDRITDVEATQAAAKFARGLAGERECEDVTGLCRSVVDASGDAPGQHGRLARPRRGDHRERPGIGGDGEALLRIEAAQRPVRLHPATLGHGVPRERRHVRTGGIPVRSRRDGWGLQSMPCRSPRRT